MTHHQAALPPGWHLAAEATLPGGRTITGTAARVYHLLGETQRRTHRWQVGRHLAPAGWVPTWVLREPWAGGSAGDRRLRDLREAGVSIESQRFDPGANEPASASWLWHLAVPAVHPSPARGRGAGGEGSPSPARGECVWEKGPGDEGPGEAGSSDSPSPAPRGRVGEGAFGSGVGPGGAGSLPLHGLTIRFLASRPAPPGAIDISPGAPSPLAPSFAACDDETYRRELLQAYHGGRQVAALTGRPEWALWADPAALYNPRPVLEAALVKLGVLLGS